MTPETQAPYDSVTYDELSGPDLDAALWSQPRLPLPTGGEHVPLDPNAELAVGGGEVRVTIPRFDFTRLRACEITLDRSRSTAAWRVDGRRVYEAHGTLIPERARIGFGIWTMLSIRDGRSRSLAGQGLDARWRQFRVRGGLVPSRSSRRRTRRAG